MNNNLTNKTWWKATGIRCLRSFLSVILGAQSANVLITDIDWKTTILAALTTTFWIFIACVIAGLPEVDATETLGASMQTLYSEYDDFEMEKIEEEKESEV